MSDRPATLKSNERFCVVGKTGSGKTYLAKRLIWDAFDHCIFYDWKHHHYDELNAPVLQTVDEVRQALAPDDLERRVSKFVFAPKGLGMETWNEVCKIAWDAGNIHILSDELKGIYQNNGRTSPISKYHEYILTRGRVRGVGITGVSQRPKKIPMETISEAEHLFIFRLNLKDDRDRVAEVIGREGGIKAGKLSHHHFLYYNTGMEKAQYCKPI